MGELKARAADEEYLKIFATVFHSACVQSILTQPQYFYSASKHVIIPLHKPITFLSLVVSWDDKWMKRRRSSEP